MLKYEQVHRSITGPGRAGSVPVERPNSMLMSTSQPSNPPPPTADRYANCPSCGSLAHFRFTGEQHWPPHIAEAAGVEQVVRLWTCERCNSTISETDLK